MSAVEWIVGAVLALACMATGGVQSYRLHRAVGRLRYRRRHEGDRPTSGLRTGSSDPLGR